MAAENPSIVTQESRRRTRQQAFGDIARDVLNQSSKLARRTSKNILSAISSALEYLQSEGQLSQEQQAIRSLASSAAEEQRFYGDDMVTYPEFDRESINRMLELANDTSEERIALAKQYNEQHSIVEDGDEEPSLYASQQADIGFSQQMAPELSAAAIHLTSNESSAINGLLGQALFALGLDNEVKKMSPSLYVQLTKIPEEVKLNPYVKKTTLDLIGIKKGMSKTEIKRKVERFRRAFESAGGIKHSEVEPSEEVISGLVSDAASVNTLPPISEEPVNQEGGKKSRKNKSKSKNKKSRKSKHNKKHTAKNKSKKNATRKNKKQKK